MADPSNDKLREVHPSRTDLLCQRPRLRSVSGALLAPVGIVETEWQIRAMISSGKSIQQRRLPDKPILIDRRSTLIIFQLHHALDIVAHTEPAHAVGQLDDRLLGSR